MCDQAVQRQHVGGGELQESHQVSLFSPAHVPNGIIDSVFLVQRIVATRTIAPGHHQLDFLLKEEFARYLKPDRSHGDDTPMVSAALRCQYQGVVGRRACGDERGVDADIVGQRANHLQGVLLADHHPGVCSQRRRQTDAGGIHVDGHDAAARAPRQLYRELADDTQADDRHRAADLGAAQP